MKNISAKVDWKKGDGLVPAIIQDADTSAVLMLGFMNRESLVKTLKTGNVWFYSRTGKRLWMKGETSKNILRVVRVKLDCDRDTLLILARPAGPTCHTGSYSCFKEKRSEQEFSRLFMLIESRKKSPSAKSYTTSLFQAGVDKMSLKVAEEALEVVHAAQKQTKKRLIEETADLFYHLFVLLVGKGIKLCDIENELQQRRK